MILAVLCELLEAYDDVPGGGAVGADFIVGWLLGSARAHSGLLVGTQRWKLHLWVHGPEGTEPDDVCLRDKTKDDVHLRNRGCWAGRLQAWPWEKQKELQLIDILLVRWCC